MQWKNKQNMEQSFLKIQANNEHCFLFLNIQIIIPFTLLNKDGSKQQPFKTSIVLLAGFQCASCR